VQRTPTAPSSPPSSGFRGVLAPYHEVLHCFQSPSAGAVGRIGFWNPALNRKARSPIAPNLACVRRELWALVSHWCLAKVLLGKRYSGGPQSAGRLGSLAPRLHSAFPLLLPSFAQCFFCRPVACPPLGRLCSSLNFRRTLWSLSPGGAPLAPGSWEPPVEPGAGQG